MAEAYIGSILMFGGNFTIRGYAQCDGQLLPIAQNTALFSLIGTIYGGDGRTTFALPDLRGRAPIHMGHGPGLNTRAIGSRGGLETVPLTIAEMPSHTHSVAAQMHGKNVAPAAEDVENAFFSNAGSDEDVYTDDPSTTDWVNMGPGTVTVTEQSTGGSQPHFNMQPYLTINFQIALLGIFPSRN